MKYFRFILVLAAWSLPALTAWSQAGDVFKSSPKVLEVFRPVVAKPSASTVRVQNDGKDAALGAVVKADGWVLTKASDLKGKITVKLADGKDYVAKIVGVDEPCDLALVKIEATGLVPITWRDSKSASPGRWVATPGPGKDPVAIGVVSVATRPYKQGDQPPKNLGSNSGYLGVQLEAGEGGPMIRFVMKDSPAAKAGLKEKDLVYQIGAKKIIDMESLINTVQRHKPGDVITIKLKRKGEDMELKATLAKIPPGFLGNPQERMGSILSNRRGGFPVILQHDTVLKPSDCGGPLVDLDGQAVGLNIARAGRVESYAIPAEKIQELLPELLSGKRAPKE